MTPPTIGRHGAVRTLAATRSESAPDSGQRRLTNASLASQRVHEIEDTHVASGPQAQLLVTLYVRTTDAYPTGLSSTSTTRATRPRRRGNRARPRQRDPAPRRARPQRERPTFPFSSMDLRTQLFDSARAPGSRRSARFAQGLAISQRKPRHGASRGTSLATLGPERPRCPLEFWPRRLPDSHAAYTSIRDREGDDSCHVRPRTSFTPFVCLASAPRHQHVADRAVHTVHRQLRFHLRSKPRQPHKRPPRLRRARPSSTAPTNTCPRGSACGRVSRTRRRLRRASGSSRTVTTPTR